MERSDKRLYAGPTRRRHDLCTLSTIKNSHSVRSLRSTLTTLAWCPALLIFQDGFPYVRFLNRGRMLSGLVDAFCRGLSKQFRMEIVSLLISWLILFNHKRVSF